MDATTIQSKRSVIENRILGEVRRYHTTFGVGMPMQVLSAKYARSLIDLGGFPEVIIAMELAGMLQVTMTKSGARLVSPGSVVAKAPDLGIWF